MISHFINIVIPFTCVVSPIIIIMCVFPPTRDIIYKSNKRSIKKCIEQKLDCQKNRVRLEYHTYMKNWFKQFVD
jgi:hypothetical protein